MNVNLLIDIVALARAIVLGATNQTGTGTPEVTAALLQILQKAALAYQQQTGQPLDPSQIKAEPSA